MPGMNYRVVHVMSSFEGGGLEQFVLRLAELQQRRGDDVRVLGLRGGKLRDLATSKGLETMVPATVDGPFGGVTAFVERASSTMPPSVAAKVQKGASAGLRILDVARYFASFRPDIVHSHNPTSLHYATIGSIFGNAPIVFTDHSQGNGIIRRGSQFEWSRVAEFVAVSADTARHSGDIGYHGPTTVIYNGAEFGAATRSRAAVRRELGIDESAVVGIHVGSFYPVKAQDVLVKACSLVRTHGVPTTMLFLGEGGERPRVEALARDLALGPETVRFLGFRKDVTDLLDAADYFVLCSRSEGLPMSILEAMARKLPVICTAVGGNPELVLNGVHGLHVAPGDASALATAIETLVLDPSVRRRFGDAGWSRVVTDFPFDKTADAYANAYSRARAAG